MTRQAPKNPPNMSLRGGIWHLRMRVPKRYNAVEEKTEIHRSLLTGDRHEAQARLALVKKKVLAELDARLSGKSPISGSHYEAIAELSSSRSFSYRTADELTASGAEAIMDRMISLISQKDSPTSETATALLGGIQRPKLTITEVAESMEKRFPEDVVNKSEKSKQTWRAQWTRPAAKVVTLLGYDPIFQEISRQDAVALRDALKDRVIEGDLKGATAQKELRLLNTLWDRFHESIGVDEREMPFSPFFRLGKGLKKMDPEDSRKLEVPTEIIKKKMVAAGALDFMNDELRDITLAIIETGARQSEITDLPPHSIILEDPVPHIWIRNETGEWAREIKNKPSKRKIPLVGVALEAFKRHPNGFARYRYKGTYSAAANKALHAHNVLPDDITVGGLRHSLESRLLAAGYPNDVRAALMGHSIKKARGREVYGNEMTLVEKARCHRRIMIKPPD
ncbi:MAG: DUF6538 domain-containing protein [Sulfitobacter sp.]